MNTQPAPLLRLDLLRVNLALRTPDPRRGEAAVPRFVRAAWLALTKGGR